MIQLKRANEQLFNYQKAAECINDKLTDHIWKSQHFPVGIASEPWLIKAYDPYNNDHEYWDESPNRHQKSPVWFRSPWNCN